MSCTNLCVFWLSWSGKLSLSNLLAFKWRLFTVNIYISVLHGNYESTWDHLGKLVMSFLWVLLRSPNFDDHLGIPIIKRSLEGRHLIYQCTSPTIVKNDSGLLDYEFWWVKYSWSCTGISTNPILKPSPPRKNEGQIRSHCVKTNLVNPSPYSIWKPRNSLNFPEFPWRNSWDIPNLPMESQSNRPRGWRLAGPGSWWHSCPWKATVVTVSPWKMGQKMVDFEVIHDRSWG